MDLFGKKPEEQEDEFDATQYIKQNYPAPSEQEKQEFLKQYKMEPSTDIARSIASEQGGMPVSKFLKVIAQIESSGGKNTKHKTIRSGMHKGHAAIGKYGLMPNTVDDIINRIPDAPEHIRAIKNMSPQKKKQFLESNPQYEDYLATQLANNLAKKFKSPTKAAYAWNQGHNIDPEKITPQALAQKDYSRKFYRLKQRFK